MSSLRSEWIVDLDRFAAIEPEWEALSANEPTPFGRHAWFRAWFAAFSGPARLRVCALWDGDGLAALMPLVRDGRRLASMANAHTPLFRPLARDADALEAVVDEVMHEPAHEVDLQALPLGDPQLECLLAGARRTGRLCVVEPQHVSPVVDLAGTYEDFREETKPRWRAPIERFDRKMRRDHDAVFSIVESPADLDAALARGFEVEASGWKGREGTAILCSPSTIAFYRDVAKAFHREEQLKLSGIYLDGDLVAFDMSLLFRRRLWTLKGGYDESFRRLAPGLVLQRSIFERCFELGLQGVEFLGDDEEWKRKFSNGERRHGRLRAFRRRPAALARYGYRRWARPSLRAAYHRLR